jgi:hypothetical protein
MAGVAMADTTAPAAYYKITRTMGWLTRLTHFLKGKNVYKLLLSVL